MILKSHEARIASILEFWFAAGNEAMWFGSSPEFDQKIKESFAVLIEPAVEGGFDSWTETAAGALALILLLDQFPRNLFRGMPRAYMGDSRARAVTRIAIDKDFALQRPKRERVFFYLPLGHSENLGDQDEAVRLAETLGNEIYLRHAKDYRDVIARFGRFPHRNAALGRESTNAEREFLKSVQGNAG